MSESKHQEYYQALIEKNSEYVGVFFVGVTTTGIFCHPTCPARKPKSENCIFYEDAQQALLAGFRPCKRCQPLSHPHQESEIVQQLVTAVEAQPEKKWRQSDVRAMCIDPSTARRQFQKRFGMTFIEYARARRLGLAMGQIRTGGKVIDAQISAGYTSGSGFRDATMRILGDAPARLDEQTVLKAAWIDTPLGPMIAVADDDYLYLLEFVDRCGLETELIRLREKNKSSIIPGRTAIIECIEAELGQYFSGTLDIFQTPLMRQGTPFQISVWDALQQIPPGQTCSYSDIAVAIGNPKGVRAVARANGANQLAIVIPCHRVIAADGTLSGYGGGIARKQWLINHEMKGENND